MMADELRERSGEVDDTDPLVEFLYALMRDHLAPGAIEQIMNEQVMGGGIVSRYTNGWLAKYAQDLAGRLKRG